MWFLVRYSRGLEEGYGRERWPDFAATLFMAAALLLCCAPLTSVLFFGSALSSVLVYLWARRNPGLQISLFGLVTLTAPWLPWALLGLGAALGNDALSDALGIAVGHLVFFLEDVYPPLAEARGWTLTAFMPNPTNAAAAARALCGRARPAVPAAGGEPAAFDNAPRGGPQ